MIHFTTRRLAASVFTVCAALLILAPGCTNTKYPDLMKVTAECDAIIAQQEQIYGGEGSLASRIDARDRIIRLRKKQMIMAQRINVNTMPEVKNKSLTLDQGQARKAEIVKAATGRYEAAEALPMPVDPAVKTAAPNGVPSGQK